MYHGQKKKSSIRQSVSFGGGRELSRSAKRLRDILKDDETDEQKLPDLLLYRNERQIEHTYFLFPARIVSILQYKLKSHLQGSLYRINRVGVSAKQKSRALRTIVRLILSSSTRENKILFLTKLLRNKQSYKNKQRSANLIYSILHQKTRSNLSVLFLSHYAPRRAIHLHAVYSQKLMKELSHMKKYEKNHFFSLSTVQLKTAVEQGIEEFQKAFTVTKTKRNMVPTFNNELILIVLRNHIQALMDMNTESEQIVRQVQKHKEQRKGMSEVDLKKIKYHEDLLDEFEEQEQKLLKWVMEDGQFTEPETFTQAYISKHGKEQERMIQSRVRIFSVICELLKNVLEKFHKPSLEKGNSSFHEMGVTHVRAIIHQLDYKVYELSTISEQIPQLETFKRTLNFSLPQHNGYFKKIVDVIIQLHHKVNKLQNSKPERLQKQLEKVQEECSYIQIRLAEFLEILSSEHQYQLKPISYPLKIQNKSPQHFRNLHQLTETLSQHLVYLHKETSSQMNWVRQVLEIFCNMIQKWEQYEQQWLKIKEKIKTHDQQQIWTILNQCIKIHQQKKNDFHEVMGDYEKKIKFFTQNLPQSQSFFQEKLTQLERQNYQLSKQLQFGKNQNLFLIKANKQQQQIIRQLNKSIQIIEKRQRVDKERIAALEGQNEQKKSIINNLNTEIRSVIKQSNNASKCEQKLKDFNSLLEKQRRQKYAFRIKVQELTQKYQEQRKLENENYEKILSENSELKQKEISQDFKIKEKEGQILQLEQCIEELQCQLSDIKQKNKAVSQDYEDQIAEEINSKNVLSEEMAEYQNKVEELNSKILQMNNQIEYITVKEENMHRQLKAYEEKEWKYKVKIEQLQQEHSVQIDQNNIQEQLARSHQQLEKSHQIVEKLEKQIQRRENLINNLQSVITDQTQKYTQNQQQWEFIEQKYNQQITSLREQIHKKNQAVWKSKRDYESFKKVKLEKQSSEDHNELNERLNNLNNQIKFLEDENKKLKNELQRTNTSNTDLQKLHQQNMRKIQALEDSGQVSYLKEKIISLEELVKIYKDQHFVLEAKVKEYRDAEKIVLEHEQYFLEKQKQMNVLQEKIEEQKVYIKYLQANPLKKAHVSQKSTMEIQIEKVYVERINKLEIELNECKNVREQHLKVEGKKLQDIMHKIEVENYELKEKIKKILQKNVGIENISPTEKIQLINQNKFLAEQLYKILLQKEQMRLILQEYPNPDFLTEFVFKTIIHFTKLDPDSAQGCKIWEQLQNIRGQYSGGQYFIVLEDFTKYNLEENTIKSYVNQLQRHKQQLQLLRNVLNSQQMKSQKTVTTLNYISQQSQ